jgi:hypothetical protein
MLTKVANQDILNYFHAHGMSLETTRVATNPVDIPGRAVSRIPSSWLKATETQGVDALALLWDGLTDGFENFFQSLTQHCKGFALMEVHGKWTFLYLLEVGGNLELLFGAPPLNMNCTLHPDWPLLPENFRRFYYVHTHLRDRDHSFPFWGPQTSWGKLSQMVPEDERPDSWRANELDPARCLVVGNDGAGTHLCFQLTKSPLVPSPPFLWEPSGEIRFVENLLTELDRDFSLFPF